MNKDSFVTILGWMTELDLKGNELIVYAVIYGFSQDNESYFHGSIPYLTKWTNTTEECVGYILKNLVKKGLIEKVQRSGKTNLYKAIKPSANEQQDEIIQSEDTQVDTSVNKDEHKEDKYKDTVENIVSYLNKKVNARYRSSNKITYKLIASKLKSGYTYDDFIHVIDVKTAEWLDNPEFSKYLRPSTLFGNKFENYVNQQFRTTTQNSGYRLANTSFNEIGYSTESKLPDIDRNVVY